MPENITPNIACIGFCDDTFTTLQETLATDFSLHYFESVAAFYNATRGQKDKFKAIISESDLSSPLGLSLKESLDKAGFSEIPFSIILDELKNISVKKLMQQGVAEIFVKPLSPQNIGKKLHFIIDKKESEKKQIVADNYQYKMPVGKRIFDIVAASLALIILSPILIIVSLLIAFESRGPIFYYSLRVGTGYQIFKFYKFRSMVVGADSKLNQLQHLNQYGKQVERPNENNHEICATCEEMGTGCQSALFADNKTWCEKLFKQNQLDNSDQTFIKIKNDPRVSRVGKFIRNTSIDELPQLWNVLKGDMSLVGNRPLPLYEAEKLTTDKYALRFMAPAGLTGLWQVSKRGKGDMSEDERISLDNDYAKKFGLLFDFKLILKTIPALFQNENV